MLSLIIFSLLFAGVRSDPSVVRFPITKSYNTSHLDKRDSHVFPLWNARFSYRLQFQLGNPPQNLEVILDTGSSDFILMSGDFLVTGAPSRGDSARFDEKHSYTFAPNNTNFRMVYADNSFYEGRWAQDHFRIGDLEIPNFNFGLALRSNSPNEMVGGIGLAVGENAFLHKLIDQPYPNLPLQLKQQGFIDYVSYSIWFNRFSKTMGYIEFGGMNPKMMVGKMYRFPIVNTLNGRKHRLSIKLDEMHLINSNSRHQLLARMSLPVLLDTGTVISRLPLSVARKLNKALGAFVYKGVHVVPCRRLKCGGGIGMVMSGIEFMFAFRDIYYPLSRTNLCIPGFLIDDHVVIGENILRNLYTVFDLENFEIGIAIANTRDVADDDDVVLFSRSIHGIKAPGYSNTIIENWHKVYDVTFNCHRWLARRDQPAIDDTATQSYISLGCAATKC